MPGEHYHASYIRPIIEETEFIPRETNNVSKDDFYLDPVLKRAVVRSLEIIGEASKNIPKDFQKKHVNIKWKDMARMSDKLIHHYFGIDYSLLWDVVKNEIPTLHSNLHEIIQNENKKRS